MIKRVFFIKRFWFPKRFKVYEWYPDGLMKFFPVDFHTLAEAKEALMQEVKTSYIQYDPWDWQGFKNAMGRLSAEEILKLLGYHFLRLILWALLFLILWQLFQL